MTDKSDSEICNNACKMYVGFSMCINFEYKSNFFFGF